MKVRHKKKKQLAININSMFVTKITYVSSATNIFLKYGWVISCNDINIAIELGLQEVEKYLKYAI